MKLALTKSGKLSLKGVEELTITQNISKMALFGFANTKDCKRIVIDPEITRLNWNHFADFENLEFIDVNNVLVLPKGCFFGCSKLKTIKSNHKLSLERFSLFHCFSLQEINCETSELEDAFGDTYLIDYPLLNNGEAKVKNKSIKEIVMLEELEVPAYVIYSSLDKETQEFCLIYNYGYELKLIPCFNYDGEMHLPGFYDYWEEDLHKLITYLLDKYHLDENKLIFVPGKLENIEDVFMHVKEMVLPRTNLYEMAIKIADGEMEKTQEAFDYIIRTMKEYLVLLKEFVKYRGNLIEEQKIEGYLTKLNSVTMSELDAQNWEFFELFNDNSIYDFNSYVDMGISYVLTKQYFVEQKYDFLDVKRIMEMPRLLDYFKIYDFSYGLENVNMCRKTIPDGIRLDWIACHTYVPKKKKRNKNNKKI